MWLPSRLRSAGLAAPLLAAIALAACSSVTPVYAPGNAAASIAVIYAKPGNRLEQIVYEDLALKLGKATSNAPVLSVKITAISRGLTSTDLHPVLPATQQEEEVVGQIRLTDVNGKLIFSGMRSATADYTANSQGLATDRAQADAAARGAHALADTIRLTLLGVLAK
jgi:hypothetical protein